MNRSLFATAIVLLLAACSMTQQMNPAPAVTAADTSLLGNLLRTLPGTYGNYAQHWGVSGEHDQSADPGHWRLSVSALRSGPAEAWFSLHQYPASDASSGSKSLWQFRYDTDNLYLRFSPYSDTTAPWELTVQQLASAARFLPGCEVRLTRLATSLAGQTQRTSCQLSGPDGELLSLVKDFAISADSINVGDRIVDPATGESPSGDRVFRFDRMLKFHGWAGMNTAKSEQWLLARPLEIWSDGSTAQLVDLSGEPMGYQIRLAQVPWRTDQKAILRLDLVAIDTGKIIAYSWADHAADMIGINLGWIQVGLTQTLP